MEEWTHVPREGEVLAPMPRPPRAGYAWAGGEEVKLWHAVARRRLVRRVDHDDLLGDIEISDKVIIHDYREE